MPTKRSSKDFGKKEKVLNYSCQTYQLSRPNKVGAVMALIRECQPKTIDDWENWYFENAYTAEKQKSKITKESLVNDYIQKLKLLLFQNGQTHLINSHNKIVSTIYLTSL